MVIHKQVVEYRGDNIQTIKLPQYSNILSCDFQGENLVIWYIFPEVYINDTQERKLLLLRTGEEIKIPGDSKFIGTAYDRDPHQPFVIHLFELTS